MQDDLVISFLNDNGIAVDKEVTPPDWGQRRLRVFQNSTRQYVFKTPPVNSLLLHLPTNLCNELFDLLYQHTNSLNLPLTVKGNYIFNYDGKQSMLFPWVGPLDGNTPRWDMNIHDQLSFLAQLNNELGNLPNSFIQILTANCFKISFSEESFKAKLDVCKPIIGNILYCKCLSLLSLKNNQWDSDCYYKLVHTDFNASNIVSSLDGSLVALDIDYIRLGNDYVDFIYIVTSGGFEEPVMEDLIRFYQHSLDILTRPLSCNMAILGCDLVLAWMSTIIMRSNRITGTQWEYRENPVDAEVLQKVCREVAEIDNHLYKAMTSQMSNFCKGLNNFLNYILK